MHISARFIASWSVAALLVAVAVRYLWLRRLRRAFADPLPKKWPYFARKTLLTKAELAFYHVLGQALRGRYTVAPKVRMADIVNCHDAAWALGYGRLIAQKHIDFLLVEPHTTRLVLAIELDDSSHSHPRRRARDIFVDQALKAAGVPLIRVPVSRSYDASSLRRLLAVG
jgi:hypothetical protein